jgi:hypothetical protein
VARSIEQIVDRTNLTQVGRALNHLGVEHIAAYSPQARGRSERLFHRLQDRLTKELALAEITTVEAANMFLRDVYILLTMRGLPSRRSKKAARLWPSPASISRRSSAFRKSARLAMTIAYRSTG